MRKIALENVFKKPYQHKIFDVIHIIHLLETYLFKVGFPPSLTLMAIFFAIVSLKYGYLCIIFDILPMSAKKEIFVLGTGRHIFFSILKKIKRDLSIIMSFFYC